MMWTEATNKQEDGGELCGAQRFRSNKIGMWIALSLSCSLSVIVPVTAQPSLPPPAASEPNVPLSPSERRGFRLVRLNCARCHAIDKVSESPLAIAPPFRTLHLKYPVSDLQRPLAQGVHPVMPRFQFEASQIEDIMAYLKTLER
jgi:mono/diheme cytochrome c family protein